MLKEPLGPVAAFTPWNFPINQIVRKLGAALATGCSTSSQPACAKAGIAQAACVSLHAMFTSTRTEPRSPSARLIAATCSISVFGSRAPIFSLKMR